MTLTQAIQQGLKDYKESPDLFASVEMAVKYRVADMIWEEINHIDLEDSLEVLNFIQKATK